MFVLAIGTATPPRRYTQVECWLALASSPQFAGLQPRSRALLKQVLTAKNGVATRHLALDSLADAFNFSPDTLHARFATHAPALASEAAERALAEAGLAASEIDGLIVSTCTGYLCPGLTSYVSERLGLRRDALCLDLVGQGCGAALPNLRTAASILAAGHAKKILCICVEVCSAAFYLDDDPGVLISACLFGDGAAAAIVSSEPSARQRRVEWKRGGTLLAPENRDSLRFETRNGILRNILGPEVPALAARHARTVFDDTASASGLTAADFSAWIFHAGGRAVLNALQGSFALPPEEMRCSAEILEEYGNLSSPFVLFTLRKALSENLSGGRWWISSFGAGFSSHGAILEVEPHAARA